jgi:DNA-binding transcriptional regulator GbsR (MarR family)
MLAYTTVSRETGISRRKIERVIGRCPHTVLRLYQIANLTAAYVRLCERIEGSADQLEATAKKLQSVRNMDNEANESLLALAVLALGDRT